MSSEDAGTPQSPLADEALTVRTRIARQCIYDKDRRLAGYELLFRGDNDDAADLPTPGNSNDDAMLNFDKEAAHHRATSMVISAAFGDFGVTELGAGQPLYINMTRPFLVGTFPLPFGPQGVVLEVLEYLGVDDELLAGLQSLRDKGYRIAVDDFVGDESRAALLPLADFVKVDVLDLVRPLAEVVSMCQNLAPDAVLVAERVEDEETFQHCLNEGFSLFQGYYFQRPALIESTRLSPSQVVCLQLTKVLAEPNPEPAEIERIVTADPALSLRVLRTANSALGVGQPHISSLQQALKVLGPDTLNTWVMLTLMGGVAAQRSDDLMTILARSRCCELLAETAGADADTAMTAGMLSGVAEVLGVKLSQVVVSAGLDQRTANDLVNAQGPVGVLVRAVEDYEHNRPEPGATAGISTLELSRAHLRAWCSAQETVAHVLGGTDDH